LHKVNRKKKRDQKLKESIYIVDREKKRKKKMRK
jgi:hypothetical protein